jgi:hypothetical protein
MRAADARPADMRPTDMRPTDVGPADMRRPKPTTAACPEAYSAAVPAKPTEMSAAVSAKAVAAAVSTATVTAAVSTATAAAGVCFECDKRHDEEQHRGHASAGRQHRPHGAAGQDAPHPRGRLSLGIPPRTKSL